MPEKCKIIQGISRGIGENIAKPAALFRKNIEIIQKITDAYYWNGYRRVCVVGSSCSYPIDAPQPYKEESLGTGPVEPTSAPYAYSNLAAWKYCEAISKECGYQYFMAIPGNLYGDPDDNHFIGDLIKKFHTAKEDKNPVVTLWGSGTPIRQPLYDEDFHAFLEHVSEKYFESSPINVANIEVTSIANVAMTISDIVGYKGDISFDCSHPDGQKKKILDNSKFLSLNPPQYTSLIKGLEKSYERFLCKKK